jgi:ATP-dependent RNA helicase SUPV3L1/SUV3
VARQQQQQRGGPHDSGTVLVASEAIGMGLNLSIHRIVMSSLTKFDGSEVRQLRPEELKQIAGRAGRYSSSLEFGEVACMDEGDVPMLNKLMHKKIPDIEAAGKVCFVHIYHSIQA